MDCSLPGSSVRGNSPGKNTGVGCHALLHGIFLTQGSYLYLLCLLHWHVGSLQLGPPIGVLTHFNHVLLFATPWTVARQAPLSVGILQARILELVAMPSSRASYQPRDRTQVSRIAGRFFTSETPGKLKNTGAGSLSLLQGIFPAQESK